MPTNNFVLEPGSPDKKTFHCGISIEDKIMVALIIVLSKMAGNFNSNINCLELISSNFNPVVCQISEFEQIN